MIFLLAEKSIQDYNIIAIQEPWRNPSAPITLSFHQSGFHLLYRPGGNTHVCFYINNTINPKSWEVEFLLPDMCTLKIITYTNGVSKLIHIHNVYNPSPLSYGSIDSPFILSVIKEQLNAEAHHILLENFNLHHPFWNDPLKSTYHAMADQLLEIINDKNLSLTLLKGTVTWEARDSFSTIDLVFMSEYLAERLEHCKSKPELNQSLNHISISTHIFLESKPQVNVKRRAWKLLDLEKLRKTKRQAPILAAPHTTAEIDVYTITVQDFLQDIINAAVP